MWLERNIMTQVRKNSRVSTRTHTHTHTHTGVFFFGGQRLRSGLDAVIDVVVVVFVSKRLGLYIQVSIQQLLVSQFLSVVVQRLTRSIPVVTG